MPTTSRHNWDYPNSGETNWGTTLNTLFNAADDDVAVWDVAANRPSAPDAAGVVYAETDTGDVYVGNSTADGWNLVGTLDGVDTQDDGTAVEADIAALNFAGYLNAAYNSTENRVDVDATHADVTAPDGSGGTATVSNPPAVDLSATNGATVTAATGSDGSADVTIDAIDTFPGLSDVQTGTLANRPAAGTAGLWYFTTDSNGIYVDDGSAWQTIAEVDTDTQLTTEQVQDAALPAVAGGTDITATYDDTNNTLTIDSSAETAQTTTTQTAAYTASNGDFVLADASGGAFTVTLPAPSANTIVGVKKIDSSTNAVTVAQNGSETIDGAASQSLGAQYDALEVISDGTNWFIK